MIAEHEVAVGGHHDLRGRTLVGVGGGYVVFFESLSIYEYFTRFDPDAVSRQADHPFDETLRSIARVAEHHDVATLDRLQAVHVLVDEDTFLVVERGHHAGAFHLHRLIQKNNNERGDSQRDHQVAQPYREHGQSARRNGRGSLLAAWTRIRWTGLFRHAGFIIRAQLSRLKLLSWFT